jgi:hypothetical protein
MANVTVTVPDAEVARVKAAVVAELGLDSAATSAQVLAAVKDWLAHHLRQLVRNHEVQQAQQAAASGVNTDSVAS